MDKEKQDRRSREYMEKMKKHSIYHIETEGFERIVIGLLHMIQTVPLGTKCQIVLHYDPAQEKVAIETFTDKSDVKQVQEKPLQ